MRKIGIFLLLAIFIVWPVRADEIQDLQQQIDELSKAREQSINATKPLESELARLQQRLDAITAGIQKAKDDLRALEASIAEREQEFSVQYALLSERVLSYYKASRAPSTFLVLFTSGPSGNLARDLFYRGVVTDRDKDIIAQISQELIQLDADKKKVEADRARLADLQVKVDKEAKFFEGEISGAKAYQQQLSGQIAALTARQQSILSEKSGTFQTTVGDVPLADDFNASPAFNPGFSPAFAAFSFGAPHFKGMSQYGAFGRAKSGQSAEDILRAYYGGGIEIRNHDVNTQVTVEGYGAYSLEEYAKRIYEVPNVWGDQGGMEALKAQAIAARSYALARGGTICATESCQVFKPEPKGGNWESAVIATSGKVVYANGTPYSTWYASTSGGYQESYSSNGYSTPGFWDTPSGRSGWTNQAYEKVAGSPWFYKGWYKSRSGDSCGRNHPWLTSEEMADVLNGWAVLFQGGGESSRVTPQGPCWGDNPYSISELRSIGGFSSVSGVSATYSDSGVTANITFNTNKGPVTINGNDFYKAFNLRAPGRIALKSGLYNVEKR